MKQLWGIIKGNHNVRLYLVFSYLQSSWFIEAVWYFYWAKFLTYAQIGWVFSFLVILGMVAEIPTGYFADRFGRRKSVMLGSGFLAVGAMLMSSATGAAMLVIGVSLMSVGRAFISGAIEALTYDSLDKSQAETSWDKLVSLKTQISMLAYLISVPIGGFLYKYYFRMPNILEMIAMIISIIIATQLSEKRINRRAEPGVDIEIGYSWKEIVIGFRELWSIKLRPYLVPSIIAITVFELYDWGLSKPAMAVNFGLDSRGQAIVYSLIAILNILAVGQMPKLRKWLGDYWGLRILNLINGLIFIGSTMIFGYLGIIFMIGIEAIGNMSDPWTSSIVNSQTSQRYRATTLSTMAFLTRIPHFFINILAGNTIQNSNINNFHFWLGIVIIILVGLTLFPWKSSYLTQNS